MFICHTPVTLIKSTYLLTYLLEQKARGKSCSALQVSIGCVYRRGQKLLHLKGVTMIVALFNNTHRLIFSFTNVVFPFICVSFLVKREWEKTNGRTETSTSESFANRRICPLLYDPSMVGVIFYHIPNEGGMEPLLFLALAALYPHC